MLNAKQIIIVVVLTAVFLGIIFSWNFFKEKPKPIVAIPLDVTASVAVVGEDHTSDDLLTVSYSWTTGPGWLQPTAPLQVFVHLQDEDGERLCQDDHQPPQPIVEWHSGETHTYERTFYVPITLLRKKVQLTVGIYNRDNTGEYYAIGGLPKFNPYHRYLAAEFLLRPSDREYSEALIRYRRGWYDPEVDKRGNVMWRWMMDRGECQVVNPRADAILYIDAWIPNVHLSEPAIVSLTIAGRDIELPEPERDFLRSVVKIPAEYLGDEEYVLLTLKTSNTFVPARSGNSIDARELGLMVKKILIRAQ